MSHALLKSNLFLLSDQRWLANEESQVAADNTLCLLMAWTVEV